jgi:hypothetical protein
VFPKIVNFLFWLLFGPKKPRKSQFNFEPKRYKMVSLSAKRSVFGLGRKKLRFFTILVGNILLHSRILFTTPRTLQWGGVRNSDQSGRRRTRSPPLWVARDRMIGLLRGAVSQHAFRQVALFGGGCEVDTDGTGRQCGNDTCR